MLEDAVLHPALPLLCWLMIAQSKGYQPPSWLLAIVLHVVMEMTMAITRDTLEGPSLAGQRGFGLPPQPREIPTRSFPVGIADLEQSVVSVVPNEYSVQSHSSVISVRQLPVGSERTLLM